MRTKKQIKNKMIATTENVSKYLNTIEFHFIVS